MKQLTPRAQTNVDSGATSGPGTLVCPTCGGAKEERRINSTLCAACERRARPAVTHSLKVTLDAATYADLSADAGSLGILPAAQVARLLTLRYEKRRAAKMFPET